MMNEESSRPTRRRARRKPRVNGHLLLYSLVIAISGYCSLTYQVVWIREFRLVFGSTTAAMAVVLAVFMGGLGLGGAVLGRRAEGSARPRLLYGRIELGIAGFAALTPFLLTGVRWLYYQTGGEAGLGYGLATLLRGGMTVVVIGVPCFLMGGTLPALAKYLQDDSDSQRRVTGWLYGINIWGGLAGVALTTFYTLEHLGSRWSLWLAAIANLIIAMVVLRFGGRPERQTKKPESGVPDYDLGAGRQRGGVSPSWCYGAALLTGMSYFLLELVWYRLSVPLTGGSVYALGMVLFVALLGLAIGGASYPALAGRIGRRPGALALLSALQVVFILIPYLMGDWFALIVANGIREIAGRGFSPTMMMWFLTVSGLALVPSIIAGIQFPLILSLLGRGGQNIGTQLGRAYAWNTSGAIAGSLIGGFILIPMLSAPGVWVAAAALAGLVAIEFLWLQWRSRIRGAGKWRQVFPMVTFILLLGSVVSVFLFPGPGSFWRHTAIGFGRMKQFPETLSESQKLFETVERSVGESWEGREAAVAVMIGKSRSIITNGKSDSSLHGDIATTVGLALIPAAVHSTGIRSAAVIGAGTGVSAGYLASFPDVEHVDLLEIEPSVIEAQKWFAGGNLDPLESPKVNLVIGDARESLANLGRSYDLILSEPSNLTRSGICNFYTLEYYRQCSERMNENGLFAQWLQGYNLDLMSLGQVIKTISEVFPRVEMWVTMGNDILLLGSFDERPYDYTRVDARLHEPAYLKALARGFRSDSAEGLFARLYADSRTLKASVSVGVEANRDDRNSLEFRIAKQGIGGDSSDVSRRIVELARVAKPRRAIKGEVRSRLWTEERLLIQTDHLKQVSEPPANGIERAFWLFYQGNLGEFIRGWVAPPTTLKGRYYMAMAAAVIKPRSEVEISEIEAVFPVEAEILRAIGVLGYGKREDGLAKLKEAMEQQARQGWADLLLMDYLFGFLQSVVGNFDAEHKKVLFSIMEEPVPGGCALYRRKDLLNGLADSLGGEYPVRVEAATKMAETRPDLR